MYTYTYTTNDPITNYRPTYIWTDTSSSGCGWSSTMYVYNYNYENDKKENKINKLLKLPDELFEM